MKTLLLAAAAIRAQPDTTTTHYGIHATATGATTCYPVRRVLYRHSQGVITGAMSINVDKPN